MKYDEVKDLSSLFGTGSGCMMYIVYKLALDETSQELTSTRFTKSNLASTKNSRTGPCAKQRGKQSKKNGTFTFSQVRSWE